MNTSSAASSIYAKPVVPRIVVRPALASVLLHGLLPHWSDVNRSARGRHAYTVHVIDGAANVASCHNSGRLEP